MIGFAFFSQSILLTVKQTICTMNYNFKEKQAIISVVMAMAKADGMVDPNELAYFEQLQELLRISNTELRSITATVDNEFSLLGLIVLSKMDDQKKADVKQMLLQMMTSDSDINEKELTLFNFICQVTGINLAADSIKANPDLDYDPSRVLDSKALKAIAAAERKLIGEGK